MVNVPECDYRSAAYLHEMYPQDSVEQWQNALDELASKEFVIRIGDKYAVNKWKIPQMKVV